MKEYIQLDLFNNPPLHGNKTNDKKRQKINLQNEPLEKKIKRALLLLRSAATKSDQPIEISYSGGKDSDVILELAKMANINYIAYYKNTTIDPPGTIKHCLENNVKIVRQKTFAEVIQKKGYPTFKRRFCCKVLKEYKILDTAVHGIRRCESVKRAKLYNEPTICRLYNKKKNHVEVFLPLLWWTDKDVADFVMMRNIRCHPLYYNTDGMFAPKRRLGCMGCPLKSDRGLADFKAHPKLVKFWLRNGNIWFQTHKIEKTKKKYKNHYEIFVQNLFFKDYESFRNAIDNMFGKIDCKQFLMNYFNIKL